MIKIILAFALSVSFANVVLAKTDTTLYYMKNVPGPVALNYSENAIPTDNKEEAAFLRAIISPDVTVDSLYSVSDYFLNGKIKFQCKSKSPTFNIDFQGIAVEFFPNGHKRRICTFNKGKMIGDVLEYFPNGRLNTIKTIPDVEAMMKNKQPNGEVSVEARLGMKADTKKAQSKEQVEKQLDAHRIYIDSINRIILTQCLDSAGIVLAENGNGKWVEYHNDYKTPFATGQVVNGHENGEWSGRLNDTLKYTCTYVNGKFISGKSYSSNGNEYPFTEVLKLPEFDGGMYGFSTYLARVMRYPADARDKNIQGRVILRFIVNADGSLSDVMVTRNVYPSVDLEACNALRQSPTWLPGYYYGVKTGMLYSVPVSFTLGHN
jgi:TonB family protein